MIGLHGFQTGFESILQRIKAIESEIVEILLAQLVPQVFEWNNIIFVRIMQRLFIFMENLQR